MKLFCIALLLFITNSIYSIILKGIVVNAEDGLPIEFANVFVSQTSIGTTTNIDGNFTLDIKIKGFFKLAITHISYYTSTVEINKENEKQFLVIKLKSNYQQIAEVKIVPHVWNKEYFNMFFNRFIGQSENAQECVIENSNAINFFGSKKGYLKAVSDSNLLIRNKRLGYLIKYKLDNFELYYTIDSTFLGVDSFQNDLNISRKNKHEKNRYFTEFKENYLKYSGEPQFFDIIEQYDNPIRITIVD